jgi:hypothetical protein
MVKLKGDPESTRELQQSLDKISLVETEDQQSEAASTTLITQTAMPPADTEPPPKTRDAAQQARQGAHRQGTKAQTLARSCPPDADQMPTRCQLVGHPGANQPESPPR